MTMAFTDDELRDYVRANLKTLMQEKPAFLVALILELSARWDRAHDTAIDGAIKMVEEIGHHAAETMIFDGNQMLVMKESDERTGFIAYADVYSGLHVLKRREKTIPA